MQTWGIHYLALPALSYEESIIFVVTCAFVSRLYRIFLIILCKNVYLLLVQLTHALYNRYEFDSVKVLPHLLLLFVLPLLPGLFMAQHTASLLRAHIFSYLIFYTTLFTSIIVYRLSPLHPLSSYPGPVLARVSKIWGALHASKGKDHLLFKRMHDKYGPYVRTGKRFYLS